MQNLSDVLKQFQQKYPKIEDTKLADIVQKIADDADVRQFWAEHQDALRADAFQLKMMDLYEFVQQKQRIARDLISDADMIRLHELITQSHAMTKLNALLTDYTEQLQTLISNLPEPTIQTQLEQLSQLLLHRDH